MSEEAEHSGRDAGGKFRSSHYAGPAAGVDAMRARMADLWAVSGSLEARCRHSASLVATTCLVPFLVASNFPALGGWRVLQGVLIMDSVLLSLWVVWKSLQEAEPMPWQGQPGTDKVMATCQRASHGGQVTVWLLEALATADPGLRSAIDAQAIRGLAITRLARRAALGQTAAAVLVFGLGVLGR